MRHTPLRDTVQSAWAWAAVSGIILAALPAMAAVRLLERDPAHYRTGRLFRWFGQLATRVNATWHIQVTGQMPEDPRRPYVVVSNHQSLADIPIISRLPWEMKWVVKAELFRVPVFGWLMRLSGDIPVDRTDKRSRAKVLVAARGYLKKRCSVMFFPEGTRSRDGRVLRFTTGAFRLAIKEGVPVLPLAIDGTQDALPKKSWRFDHETHVRLKVLAPVETAGLTAADAERLRDEVRGRIVAQIAAWRGILEAEVDARAPTSEVKDAVKTDAATGSPAP